MKRTDRRTVTDLSDVEELLGLYRAWFAVLLRRMGQEELFISREEIAGALRGFACSVSRREDGYVIRAAQPEKEGRDERA